MAKQVQCIVKEAYSQDRYHSIQAIGGTSGGTRWSMTKDAAIQAIESRTESFYVEQPVGHRVGIVVATRLGRKYLKTERDGEAPDNLLSLPNCP